MFMLQNLKLVENVKKLAAKKNVTAGQMALAWLQHQVPRNQEAPGYVSFETVLAASTAIHTLLSHPFTSVIALIAYPQACLCVIAMAYATLDCPVQ